MAPHCPAPLLGLEDVPPVSYQDVSFLTLTRVLPSHLELLCVPNLCMWYSLSLVRPLPQPGEKPRLPEWAEPPDSTLEGEAFRNTRPCVLWALSCAENACRLYPKSEAHVWTKQRPCTVDAANLSTMASQTHKGGCWKVNPGAAKGPPTLRSG